MKWEIIKDKSKDYCLELRGTEGGMVYHGKEEKPIWNYYAIAKWDGCITFYTYSNGYGYDHECEKDCQCCEENMHICDLSDMVKTLLDLKKVATEWYQNHGHAQDWPED
jgi:hypothetical protein